MFNYKLLLYCKYSNFQKYVLKFGIFSIQTYETINCITFTKLTFIFINNLLEHIVSY